MFKNLIAQNWTNPEGIITKVGLGNKSAPTIIETVLNFLITIVIIAAVVVIIVAGITFITSQGKPDKAKEAQMAITYALIGIIVALAAGAVVRWVVGKLTS